MMVRLRPKINFVITELSDINDRMPREEARAIFDLIKPIGILL